MLDALQQAAEHGLQHLPVQLLFVLEVVVNQGAVDPGVLGDLPDGDGIEPLARKELPAGGQDVLPGSRFVAACMAVRLLRTGCFFTHADHLV